MPTELWHARQPLVELALARLTATVEPACPGRGVHALRVDAQPLVDAAILEVDLSPIEAASAKSIDVVLRGGDLAVTYADRPRPAMRTQVYWRAASHKSPGAVAAIELVVSVETSLLDSSPALVTRSRLAASDALHLVDAKRGEFRRVDSVVNQSAKQPAGEQPSGFLFRLANCDLSYAEMVHPGDEHTSHLETGAQGTVHLHHRLFATGLEKGVILRARMLGLLVDRSGDERAMVEHFASFAASELPLTT